MGEQVTIERKEYDAMRARLQELEDIVDLRQVEAALAAGETEALPIEMARRLIMGEPPVMVWREYRGLSRAALSEAAGLSEATINAAEADPGGLSLADATHLARALQIDVDDLAPASVD